jgi:hypothetical protein
LNAVLRQQLLSHGFQHKDEVGAIARQLQRQRGHNLVLLHLDIEGAHEGMELGEGDGAIAIEIAGIEQHVGCVLEGLIVAIELVEIEVKFGFVVQDIFRELLKFLLAQAAVAIGVVLVK